MLLWSQSRPLPQWPVVRKADWASSATGKKRELALTVALSRLMSPWIWFGCKVALLPKPFRTTLPLLQRRRAGAAQLRQPASGTAAAIARRSIIGQRHQRLRGSSCSGRALVAVRAATTRRSRARGAAVAHELVTVMLCWMTLSTVPAPTSCSRLLYTLSEQWYASTWAQRTASAAGALLRGVGSSRTLAAAYPFSRCAGKALAEVRPRRPTRNRRCC